MLGRKQSLKGEPVLADYGPEESLNESADIEWVNMVRVEMPLIAPHPIIHNFPFAAMGSPVDATVCTGVADIGLIEYAENIRTPSAAAVFHVRRRHNRYDPVFRRNDCQNAHARHIKSIIKVFLLCFCFVHIFFFWFFFFLFLIPFPLSLSVHLTPLSCVERQKSLQGEVPYLKDHWCQFDASMVIFLWLSITLQIFEMMEIVPRFSSLSIIRAPRPLIMIRFLRVFLKFSMPKSRINQIFK